MSFLYSLLTALQFIGAAFFSIGMVVLIAFGICNIVKVAKNIYNKRPGLLGEKRDNAGEMCAGIGQILLPMIFLFVLWAMYYKPNFFTDYYFGLALDRYDEKLFVSVDDGGRRISSWFGEDGSYVVQFKPDPVSKLFDVYLAHCFPKRYTPFMITACKEFSLFETRARDHYNYVAEVLEQKYGYPQEMTESSVRYNVKDRTIELALANVNGKTVVSYNVFDEDLMLCLPEDVREYRRMVKKMEGRPL